MREGDPIFPAGPSGWEQPPTRSDASVRRGRLLPFARPRPPASPPSPAPRAGRWIAAAVAGALALLSGLLFSLLPRPPIDSAALIARVFPAVVPQSAELANALLHEPFRTTGPSPAREREFRLGVDLLDLHLAIARDARRAAAGTARELSGLAAQPWATLYRRAASRLAGPVNDTAPTGAEIGAAEHSQTASRPVAICLGRWIEAARLAARSGSTTFFSHPDTLPTLRWFLDQKDVAFDPGTVRALWTLARRLEGGPLTAPELALLRGEFEHLVATNGELGP